LTVLVGLNGAGKSSIINLLLRFYHPQRGSIRWNGVDIGSLRPAGLRGRICGVLQEPGCYELTAMGNLVLGNGGRPVELAVAREAAQQANVLEAIERLPRGFDTLLSTRRADEEGSTGVTLSGGEWQRLALGRALIGRDRDLLVLDEANSRLDVAADSVLNTLLTGLRDVTRLVVTHRMDTVRLADLIYVIEDGTAVEAGGYQELLARGGVLATLASTQESTPASTVG
jgi:ATP-binding cassette subfamily B protein